MDNADPKNANQVFGATYVDCMCADMSLLPDPFQYGRYRPPLLDHDHVREIAEPVLRNSNLLKKAACKALFFSAHIRHASVPLGVPRISINKGEMWVTANIHWEECGYLSNEQFTDLFIRLVADAIIFACEKYGTNSDEAKELANRYDRPTIEFSPLIYKATVDLESPQNDETRTKLTSEEMFFTALNIYQWAVEFIHPLKEERLNKLSIDTRYVTFSADAPFHSDDFVKIANAMLKSPLARLRISSGERSAYWPNLLSNFKWVPRIWLSQPPDTSGMELLSPDLLLLEYEPEIVAEESLDFLKHFRTLKWLLLRGPQIELNRYENLSSLEALRLCDVSQHSIESLFKLSQLQSLSICRSAGTPIKDLAPLTDIQSLRYLELAVLKLDNIDSVNDFQNLEYLSLDKLNNLVELPDMSDLKRLRRLQLNTLKRLNDISAIAKIPNLEELIVYGMPQFTSENFKCLIAHPTLKSIYIEPTPKGESVTKMLGLTGLNARRIFEFSEEPPILIERTLRSLSSNSRGDSKRMKNAPKDKAKENAHQELAVCIKLTDDFPDSDNLRLYGDLEDAMDKVLGDDLLGYVEGNDVGAGFYTIYCQGPNANAMYKAVSAEFSKALPKGSYFEVEGKSGKKSRKTLTAK